jgi:hypothetical protein
MFELPMLSNIHPFIVCHETLPSITPPVVVDVDDVSAHDVDVTIKNAKKDSNNAPYANVIKSVSFCLNTVCANAPGSFALSITPPMQYHIDDLVCHTWFIPGPLTLWKKKKTTREHKRAVGFIKRWDNSVILFSNTPFWISSSSVYENVAKVNDGDCVTFTASSSMYKDYKETYVFGIKPTDPPAPPISVPSKPLSTKTNTDCDVCFSYMKFPHVLDGCGHSFCSKCCFKLSAQVIMKCPKCRLCFEKVVPNYELNTFLVHHSTEKEKSNYDFPRDQVITDLPVRQVRRKLHF